MSAVVFHDLSGLCLAAPQKFIDRPADDLGPIELGIRIDDLLDRGFLIRAETDVVSCLRHELRGLESLSLLGGGSRVEEVVDRLADEITAVSAAI